MSRSLQKTVLRSFFLLMGLASCSNDAPDDGGSKFQITGVALDSLYWGETVEILGDQFGTDTNSLKVYIGDVQHYVTSVEETKLRTVLRDSVRNGNIRIEKAGKTIAANLAVYPRGISTLQPNGFATSPAQAYPGDLLVIAGNDMAWRTRDVQDLKIGGIAAHVDSVGDHKAIYTRIPEGAPNGNVTFTLRGELVNAGQVFLLKHGGGIMTTVTLGTVILNLDRFADEYAVFQLDAEGDTISKDFQVLPEEVGSTDPTFNGDITTAINTGDSITWQERIGLPYKYEEIDLRLHRHTDRNVASGTIRITKFEKAAGIDYLEQYDITIDRMPWVNGAQGWTAYSVRSGIPSQLVKFETKFHSYNLNGGTVRVMTGKRILSPTAVFRIRIF